MSRIVKYFAIAGGTIPILLLLIANIELAMNVKTVPYSTTYGLYLWPSSVMLIGGAETLTPGMALRLGIAIIVNVLLYIVVGLLISGIVKSWQSLAQVRGQ